jgi:hypothetical protein
VIGLVDKFHLHSRWQVTSISQIWPGMLIKLCYKELPCEFVWVISDTKLTKDGRFIIKVCFRNTQAELEKKLVVLNDYALERHPCGNFEKDRWIEFPTFRERFIWWLKKVAAKPLD